MQETVTTIPRPSQYGTTHWLRVVVPSHRAPLMVKLFHDSEDRESPAYGPYVFVHTMAGVMRGVIQQDPRTDEVIAVLDADTGLWRTQETQWYTDVVCWTAPGPEHRSRPLVEALQGTTTPQTWRVRVRYVDNPAGPHTGTELVVSDTPPQYGTTFRGVWGRATIQSRRPTRVPAGLSREDALRRR